MSVLSFIVFVYACVALGCFFMGVYVTLQPNRSLVVVALTFTNALLFVLLTVQVYLTMNSPPSVIQIIDG